MHTWFDRTLILTLIGVDLAMVGVMVRTLAMHPAPPFGRLSLRREALKMLSPGGGLAKTKRRWSERLREAEWLRFVAYAAALFALVQLPWEPRWGALGSDSQSAEFLRTLWQVVAAALGVSVAMVAFAFQAFASSGQRAYGGSLREFAQQSRLLLVIELGLLSLLLDGVVLLGWGHNAPRGLPAAWAIALSAATLIGVGFVMHRVVGLLDDRALRQMRAVGVNKLVDAAMRQQLIGQASEVWLEQTRLPVRRVLLAPTGAVPLRCMAAGDVVDLRLGPIARFAVRHPHLDLKLAVGLGNAVTDRSVLLYTSAAISRRTQRHLASSVRVRADKVAAGVELTDALERLHQQAMDAARSGSELEWRAISDLYERVLLSLPVAAANAGVAFAGAVLAPGFFGQGPVQRIASFLYDQLVAAVDSNSRELIGPITYSHSMSPRRLCASASRRWQRRSCVCTPRCTNSRKGRLNE
jgi:hypothetical protein